MANVLVYSTSGITSGKKRLSQAQNGSHFEILKYEIQLKFELWYEKIVPSYEKQIHDDDVIDDIIGWPRGRPSMFLYKWNNVFHDN